MEYVTEFKPRDVWDIGKPTMRGVRKCPKCGTMNGTRGLACKNKVCDMVFRSNSTAMKKVAGEACKLYTGTDMQIYSVRLSRDRGPDYRGFVLLPMVEGLEPSSRLEGEAALLVQSASRCYVEHCPRSQLKEMEVLGEGCSHILSCMSSTSESLPAMLRNSAMNDLEIRSEFKHEVYSFVEHISGPLVQRVNKQVFVVKCEADTRHPLGYLHIAFIEQKIREKPGTDQKFFCTCDTFRGLDRSSRYWSQWSESLRSSEPDWILKRCIHYYACLCAFASDQKLREEFRYYIELDCVLNERDAPKEVLSFMGRNENGEPIQVEVLSSLDDTREIDLYEAGCENISTEQIEIQMETPNGLQTITVPATVPSSVSNKRPLMINHDKTNPAKKKLNNQSSLLDVKSNFMGVIRHESAVSLGFIAWLASITERINQTMHYQFPGTPEPLVFHAPAMFFDCLRDRISAGSKKKRLPNSTIAFSRRDALPLGTFTKYTWNITSLRHVQQIFDTTIVGLEFVKIFVENKDGTFSVAPPSDQAQTDRFSKLPGKQKIKAHELKTFLRVGNTPQEPQGTTPFDIEWIPDLLPSTKIGELRIKFEYGHQRNGQIDRRFIQC